MLEISRQFQLNQQRSASTAYVPITACYARLPLPERCFERVENLRSTHKRKHDAWRYLDN